MQWSREPNPGFSSAARTELHRSSPGGTFGSTTEQVNAADQRRGPRSRCSNWFQHTIQGTQGVAEDQRQPVGPLAAGAAGVLALRLSTRGPAS